MNKREIEIVSWNLSNPLYHGNLTATEQLVNLFDKIAKKPLKTLEDYINMYDSSFYTYWTWEELVKSEEEQNNGMTEEECKEELCSLCFFAYNINWNLLYCSCYK